MTDSSEKWCSLCGGIGHLPKDCPWKKKMSQKYNVAKKQLDLRSHRCRIVAVMNKTEQKMTQFDKNQFHGVRGGTIVHYGDDYQFVARFKYGGKSSKASFLSFLIKNFTVEEYFACLAEQTPPLKILESKGYLPPIVKKALKGAGYPQTVEGRRQYIADRFVS